MNRDLRNGVALLEQIALAKRNVAAFALEALLPDGTPAGQAHAIIDAAVEAAVALAAIETARAIQATILSERAMAPAAPKEATE